MFRKTHIARLFLALALGTVLVVGIISAQTASKRGLVANLKNTVVDSCGCYFRFRGSARNAERYIFSSSIDDDQKMAWMNIAGRDLKLTLEKEEGLKGREQERVGARSTARFAAGDIKVSATYVVTRVCDTNDESCESTDYDATFVVRKGGKSQVVKAAGSCGC
ncbi:MAG: hypothetical protein ACR2G5_17215 [Pyrinomonadaceae bacterium]